MQHIHTIWSRISVLLAIASFLITPAIAHTNDGCGVQAGTMSTDIGPICMNSGGAMIIGVPGGDTVVPDGFTTAYLITRTNGLLIEQVSTSPTFTVTTSDVWRIHALVYDPGTLDLSLIHFDVTSAYDLQSMLLQGGGNICASLNISGAPTKTGYCEAPCEASASGMSIDSTTVCLVNGQATLTAIPVGTSTVPPGFVLRYLLSRTNGIILEQVSTTPVFTVSSEDVWRIHALVYDPTTIDLGQFQFGVSSVYDLQALLPQAGGTICGSLDISGAPVKTGICHAACTADAGLVSADQADLCLTEGEAVLSATPDGTSSIPIGYTTAYLLALGPDQTIQATSVSPAFTVHAAGLYTMHALVFDPSTLDLGSIIPGTTTIDDLNATLMQGGGGICASLDLEGAQFQVVACSPPCMADAGTLHADTADLCLNGGMAALIAASNGDTLVPAGYETAYLLTSGSDLVVMQTGPQPAFDVTDSGLYAIHGMVYDPLTFDLTMIQLGVTTVYQLSDTLVQGGGPVCAGLDVLGASFIVHACQPECTAGEDTVITVCPQDPPFQMFDMLGGDPCPGGTWYDPADQAFGNTYSPGSMPDGIFTYVVVVPGAAPDLATLAIYHIECPDRPDKAEPGLHEAPVEATGIRSHGLIGALSIWPNPVEWILHVALPAGIGNVLAVHVLDVTGREVVLGMTWFSTAIDIDATDLPAGPYTVRITASHEVYNGRFIRSAR